VGSSITEKQVKKVEDSEQDLRRVWDTIGERDPYCGTGGPTRAIPRAGVFAKPDDAIFSVIGPSGPALDVGCGYGRNCIPLAKRWRRNVVACDVSLNMSQTVRKAGIPFVLCDLRQLPFRRQSFEYLLCSVVLIHLPRREISEAIRELKRVARQLLIIMPNPLGPASLLGLKPLLFGLLIWLEKRGRPKRAIFENIPTPRGYFVNFYFPWAFRALLKGDFDNVAVTSATKGRSPHPYLTDRLLYTAA